MAGECGASLYVYGSVANGTVRPGSSDVDLRWRRALESGTAAADLLGTRAARKTLLAVAGLVSVRDRTWTTDRSRAARRWGEIEPGLAAPLGQLLSWATADRRPAPGEVRLALADDGIVAAVVDRFASLIGVWPDDPGQLR